MKPWSLKQSRSTKLDSQRSSGLSVPVLAAANPSSGKFITQQDIFSQINLPPALISRFDLIFAMLDKPDKESDDRVARHVLSTKQNAIVGKETPKTHLYRDDEKVHHVCEDHQPSAILRLSGLPQEHLQQPQTGSGLLHHS